MILPGNLKDFATRTLHEDNMLQFQNILQCIFSKICEADNARQRECPFSHSHSGSIPTIGNTLVAQERQGYGQGLKQDASSDRNCVVQIRFTLFDWAR